MSFAHSQNNNIQTSTLIDVANQYVAESICYHQPTGHGTVDRWTIGHWLSDLDFKETQKDIFANRTNGTGQWMLDSPEFNEWVAGGSKVLWCPGARKVFIHYL